MKYSILFALMLTGIAYGQKHMFGIEAGPSLATTIVNYNDEYPGIPHDTSVISPRMGFYAGVSYTCWFSKHVGIKANVGFERKGCTLPIYDKDSNGFVTGIKEYRPVNGDYIVISPELRLRFGNNISFTGDLGPYLGILSNPTYSSSKVDFGFNVSPGLLIPIGTKFAISIISKNSFGLIPLTTVQQGGYVYTERNFSSTINFGFNLQL